MPENKHYTRRIPPQHRRPMFLQWLSANLTPHLESEILLNDLSTVFDLDNAVGVQLDVLGQIVGRNRLLSFDPSDGSSPLLNDQTYRTLLKAKISINHWNGTIPGVMELWENLFPQYTLIIQDNQNMTMNLFVIGFITIMERELIVRGYTAPKPQGVLLHYTFISENPKENTVVYIGAANPLNVMCTRLPWLPDMPLEFDTDVYTGTGVVSVGDTRLPLSEEVRGLDAEVNTNAGTATVGETRLPPMAEAHQRAFIRDAETGEVEQLFVSESNGASVNTEVSPAFVRTARK